MCSNSIVAIHFGWTSLNCYVLLCQKRNQSRGRENRNIATHIWNSVMYVCYAESSIQHTLGFQFLVVFKIEPNITIYYSYILILLSNICTEVHASYRLCNVVYASYRLCNVVYTSYRLCNVVYASYRLCNGVRKAQMYTCFTIF